jgi:hypothetical protein
VNTILCWLKTIVGWIELHDGFLTVLATIAIAAFTFALKRSTDKLWAETRTASKIALEHAKALTLSERAYVKISHNSSNLICEAFEFKAIFDIKNYGRTPATVTDVVYI